MLKSCGRDLELLWRLFGSSVEGPVERDLADVGADVGAGTGADVGVGTGGRRWGMDYPNMPTVCVVAARSLEERLWQFVR